MHIFTNMCSSLMRKVQKNGTALFLTCRRWNCTSTTIRSDQYKTWFSQSHTSVKLPSLGDLFACFIFTAIVEATSCAAYILLRLVIKMQRRSGKAYFDMGCVTSSLPNPDMRRLQSTRLTLLPLDPSRPFFALHDLGQEKMRPGLSSFRVDLL